MAKLIVFLFAAVPIALMFIGKFSAPEAMIVITIICWSICIVVTICRSIYKKVFS